MEIQKSDSQQQSFESSPKALGRSTELKRQKGREPKKITFSEEQVHTLEEQFSKNKYPSKEVRCELANDFDIPENKIKVWFQNRRMKEKRDRMMSLHSLALQRQLLAIQESREADGKSQSHSALKLSDKNIPPTGIQTVTPRCYGQCCVPPCSPDYSRYDSLSPLSPHPPSGSMLSNSQLIYSPINPSNFLQYYPHLFNSGLLPSSNAYRISPSVPGNVQLSPLPFFPPRSFSAARSEPPIPFFV